MQIIEIFINELSLKNKDFTSENISVEMSNFSEMLSLIAQKTKNYKRIELFVNLEGLKEQEFFDSLEIYGANLNADTIRNIKARLDKSKNWQDPDYQQHKGEDNFYYLNLNEATLELVNGTSLAEIAHRKTAQSATQFLLINFSNSKFQHDKFVSIIKQVYDKLPQLIHIAQIDNIKSLRKWLQIEIDLRNALDDNQAKFEEIKQLLDASNFDIEQWKPAQNYLPLASISNVLVENDWDSFRENLRKNAQDKNAIISTLAKQVALINGYQYDKKISDLNKNKGQLREIYSAGKNRETIYLSVDFETGGFEVCDFSGIHLGEYWFDGTQTQKAQPQDHSIKL